MPSEGRFFKLRQFLGNMKRAIGLVIGLFLLGCIQSPTGGVTGEVLNDTYDVTEEDVYDLFDQNLITSEQVTVKGVGLGDNLIHIFRAFGTESYIEEFQADNIVNVIYTNEDNKTMIIFHLVDSKVARIAIRKGMRDQLIGRTAEANELQDITRAFGKPDENVDLSKFRIYTYHDKGLEIYHKRKKMIGFGLIPPS